MALGFYFSPASMSAEQYDECIRQLKKAGAAHPRGRRYHACFGSATNVQVFDVWESQASFDKFGQTLIPILQGLGVDPGQPMVTEVHNVIVPPAKTPSARKTAARRPAARKARATRRRSRRK